MLGFLPILWPFLRSEAVTGPLADRRILVMEFANETRVEELDGVGGVAATWIAQELARTGLVDVLPWSMVLRERSFLGGATQPRGPGAGSAVDALATELAIGAGAGFAVSGDYFVRNDSIIIHARVLDVAEGIVLRAVETAPVPGAAYLSAVGEVRRRLAGAIAATLDPRLVNWSSAAGQPPSFEAYRAYAAGLDAFFEERYHRADTLFGRAAELDSTFAAPLVWRIRTRSEGLDATGRAAQTIAELERRALVLPPWEAAMLDYYRSTVLGTQEQRYTHARRLAAIAPNSEWQVMRIEAAFATRRFEEAARLAENLDYERGWLRDWPYARQLRPSALHLVGDYEVELASAAQLDGHLPGEAVRTRLRALIALGRIDESTALLEQTLPGLPWRPSVLLLGYAAGELNVHDQGDLAEALISRGLEIAESSQPEPGQEVPHAMMLGRINRTARRFEASRRAFTSILSADAGPGLWEVVTKELALTAAAAGDRDEALRLMAMFEQRNDPRSRGWHSLQMAHVYAALGDRKEAVRLIRRSGNEGAGYYFWLHASQELHRLEGYPPYDELMRPRR